MRRTLVPRMEPYSTSIFAEMSMLAVETGAINLGQGFPDTDGPDEMKEIARAAISEGRGNQYPRCMASPICEQRSLSTTSASTGSSSTPPRMSSSPPVPPKPSSP